jgi:hypothetical protein
MMMSKIRELQNLDDDLDLDCVGDAGDHFPEVDCKLPQDDAEADNEAEQHRQDEPAAERNHRFDTALRLVHSALTFRNYDVSGLSMAAASGKVA